MKLNQNKLVFCVYLALGFAAFIVFWQVRSCDFVYYDDPDYVSENPHVQAGLTRDGVIWAFTASHAANWHPLTWLSHMLDCRLFGLNPHGHHLTNLLFHIANTLLLFWVLRKMTGALWQSAFVAALFALHPLHVESVAWISERKDVLSTLFWLLTMAAYLRYTNRPNITWYLLTLVVFALGLMAKPMLVTLPFVLLLLDYWPLERLQLQRPHIFRLVLEKIPFFVLSAVSGAVTFLVQKSSGAVVTAEGLPLNLRIANAFISYARYIGKMILPTRLAVFYPHSGADLPLWQISLAVLLLVGVSIWVIRLGLGYKYLPVGWFWYLGTLVPVLGLVQVGEQSLADRYTYVSFTGLFIIIAWGFSDLLKDWKHRRIVLGTSAMIILFILSVCTHFQLHYWRNTVTLFEHTLAVTDNNYIVHHYLAKFLYKQGRIDEAIAHDSEALLIQPECPQAHNNLGMALVRKNRLDEAVSHFEEAVRLKPDFAEAHSNLGVVLGRQEKLDEAVTHFNEALRFRPNFAEAHTNISVILVQQGKLDEAAAHLTKALQIDPSLADAHRNLGIVFAKQGRLDEAIAQFAETLRIKPDDAEACYSIGIFLYQQGKIDQAAAAFRKTLQINPNHAKARQALQSLLKNTK